MHTKLAGLVTIIAAVGAFTLGTGVTGATPAVVTHHDALAAEAAPDLNSSGEGPNR